MFRKMGEIFFIQQVAVGFDVGDKVAVFIAYQMSIMRVVNGLTHITGPVFPVCYEQPDDAFVCHFTNDIWVTDPDKIP